MTPLIIDLLLFSCTVESGNVFIEILEVSIDGLVLAIGVHICSFLLRHSDECFL